MRRNLAKAAPLGASVAAGILLGLIQSQMPPKADVSALRSESRSSDRDTEAHLDSGLPPGCTRLSSFQLSTIPHGDSSSVGFVVRCDRR